MSQLNFQQPLLQTLVSHDPSKIIIIRWYFDVRKKGKKKTLNYPPPPVSLWLSLSGTLFFCRLTFIILSALRVQPILLCRPKSLVRCVRHPVFTFNFEHSGWRVLSWLHVVCVAPLYIVCLYLHGILSQHMWFLTGGRALNVTDWCFYVGQAKCLRAPKSLHSPVKSNACLCESDAMLYLLPSMMLMGGHETLNTLDWFNNLIMISR